MTNKTEELHSEFDEFMKDWNNSHTEVDHIVDSVKTTSKFTPHKDGYDMINDIDKYLKPHNIWEFLRGQGFNRKDIKIIRLDYDNTKNIVKNLEVEDNDGNVAGFNDIYLEDY